MFPLLPPPSLFLNKLEKRKKKGTTDSWREFIQPFRKKIAIKQRESMTFFSPLGEGLWKLQGWQWAPIVWHIHAIQWACIITLCPDACYNTLHVYNPVQTLTKLP